MSNDFYVVPDDTLWLRSGEPFTAGESGSTSAVFPPSPWSWQGMIRTRILVHQLGEKLGRTSPDQIAARIGRPDALPPGWRIRGPFPAKEIAAGLLEPWLPWPLFLSRPTEQGPQRSRQVPAGLLVGSSSDHAALHLPPDATRASSGWISASGLRWALLGAGHWSVDEQHVDEKTRASLVGLPPFVAEELRPGVAVDRGTGRAIDEQLYTGIHHRFRDGTGLWGALDGAPEQAVQALHRGGAELGRRARTVSLLRPKTIPGWAELLSGAHLQEPPDHPELHLRVVLLSPALVRPSVPPFPLPAGCTLRGIEGNTGPAIGGFDRVGGGGRPVRATWAAGSSFWVTLAGPPEERSAHMKEILGLERADPSWDEPFGFGQRVGALFDPSTGTPLHT